MSLVSLFFFRRDGDPEDLRDGYFNHEFVSSGQHDGEADLTVNPERGEVVGRVIGSDGDTFLIK